MNHIRIFAPESDDFTGKKVVLQSEEEEYCIFFLLTRQASDSEMLTTYVLTKINEGLYELVFLYMGRVRCMLLDLDKQTYQETGVYFDRPSELRKGRIVSME